LILYYDYSFTIKIKPPVSSSHFNQQISSEKFKILIHADRQNLCNFNINKYLINECNKKNINFYILKYLIIHGASIDVNLTNRYGETPPPSLFIACKHGTEFIIKYLIEHGADVNIANKNGVTPLIHACFRGIETILKCLVEHGADVNKKR